MAAPEAQTEVILEAGVYQPPSPGALKSLMDLCPGMQLTL